MINSGKYIQTEAGMVLMSSLAILSVLVVVGIGANVMLQNDYRVLANLRGGTEAFYVSVAGLEWGKSEIASLGTFPPVPDSRAQAFSTGEFAVSFLTPTVTGPLAASIILRSVGASRGARHVVEAQLTKSYDLADAAVGLRGNGAGVNLSADGTYISGADHDATGTPVAGAKSRNSVSTADQRMEGLVTQAVGAQGILDSRPETPAVATSPYLDAASVSRLADDLCSAGSLHALPSSGNLTVENQVWGSQASPQLHCFDGLSDSGDSVTLAGSFSGVGLLVVRNADLILSGAIRWEGLILVTGNDVSLRSLGSGTKDLLGAVLLNETGNPVATRKILDIQGAVRILFSRQTLLRSSSLISAESLNSAYQSLPSVISQNYWRVVTQ
jgi:hypothetical protein